MNVRLKDYRSRVLLLTAGLAAAYFIAGSLGLLLAIPPGYATAVWPASGFALAALLRFGTRLWPGVLIGSFLVNISSSADFSSLQAGSQSLLISISIGIGATFQALMGVWLVKHQLDLRAGLIDSSSIIRFYLFAGPVSCMVGASWGVSTLFIAGLVPVQEVPFNLATWWVGDTIGVLLVVPLLLILFGTPRKTWSQRSFRVAVPMLITLMLTVVLFVLASKQQDDKIAAEFNREATLLADAVNSNLSRNVETIYSLRNFLMLSDNINRKRFRQFVQRAFEQNPGLHALSWNPVISGLERTSYEQRIRDEGFDDFNIREKDNNGRMVIASDRERYVVVNYIEPMDMNARAFGYDVYSNIERKNAMDLASSTGRMVATDPIRLVQETGKQAGVLFFLPVFRDSTLLGFVVGVLRTGDLLQEALHKFSMTSISVKLFDLAHGGPVNLLSRYSYDQQGQGLLSSIDGESDTLPAVEQFSSKTLTTTLSVEKHIDIGQRYWSVKIDALAGYSIGHRPWATWWVLTSGLIISSLVGMFLLILTGRAIQDHNRAQLLAYEIHQRKEIEQILFKNEKKLKETFEQAAVGIAHVSLDGHWLKVNQKLCEIIGYNSDELLSMTFQDITYIDDLQADLEYVNQLLEGKISTYSMEKRYIRKKGGTIWINLTVSLVYNLDSEPDYFISVIEDISNRKQMELEHKAALDRNTLLLESTGEAIYGIDNNGSCTFANPMCLKMLGYDNEQELIGINMHNLIHHTRPDGRQLPLEQCRMYIALMKNRGCHVDNDVFWRKDGSSFQVEYWSHPMIKEGKTLGAVVTFIDITERRQIEKEKQQLMLDMDERIKELQCMYSVTEAIRSCPDISSIIDSILLAIPPGMYYAEFARARITVDDKLYSHTDEAPTTWLLSSPIMLGNEQRGKLEVFYTKEFKPRDEGPFLHQERQLLDSIAKSLSEAIEHRNAEQELQRLASFDPLTSLYNRTVLEQKLDTEFHRSARYHHPLSLFMIDLDHFKQINDSYGHNAGDTVLQQFAGVLLKSTRNSDFAARFGGEEFILVLPETSLEDAFELAERLRLAIEEQVIDVSLETNIQVTASIGVASFPQHGDSWEALLESADKAMYEAKNAGRNMVRAAA